LKGTIQLFRSFEKKEVAIISQLKGTIQLFRSFEKKEVAIISQYCEKFRVSVDVSRIPT
jgi:hypothetical protein